MITYVCCSRYWLEEASMNKRLFAITLTAVGLLASLISASNAFAGWGRTRVYVPTVAPVVVTNRVVVPATTYYAPTTTYYAPAPTVVQRTVLQPTVVQSTVVQPTI